MVFTPIATVHSAGTAVSGTGSVDVVWPDHAAADLGFLVIQTAYGASTLTPAGWTHVTGSPHEHQYADYPQLGNNLQILYKFAADGAEANVATGDSGDHQLAVIVVCRGVDTSTPIHKIAHSSADNDLNPAGQHGVAFDAVTTTELNCLCLLIGSNSQPIQYADLFYVDGNLEKKVLVKTALTTSGVDGSLGISSGIRYNAGTTGAPAQYITDYGYATIEFTIALLNATA